MWVDEETYNNMMLGSLVGTVIGLMFAAVIWTFRLAFGANRWFYNFLKDKGLKGWQSFLICAGITLGVFAVFCSPIILSSAKILTQPAFAKSERTKQEKQFVKNDTRATAPIQKTGKRK